MKKFHKKGFDLGSMPTLAIMIVVTAVVIAIGASVLTQTQSTQCTGVFNATSAQCFTNVSEVAFKHGGAWNATGDGITGLGTFSDNIPTIAIVIVGAVVIGILSTAFIVTKSQ